MDAWSYDSTTPMRLQGLDRKFFICTFQAVFSFGFPVTVLPHVCYMTPAPSPCITFPDLVIQVSFDEEHKSCGFPLRHFLLLFHPHKSNYSSPCPRKPLTCDLSLKWKITFFTHIRNINAKNYNSVHLIHDACRRRIKLSNNIICVCTEFCFVLFCFVLFFVVILFCFVLFCFVSFCFVVVLLLFCFVLFYATRHSDFYFVITEWVHLLQATYCVTQVREKMYLCLRLSTGMAQCSCSSQVYCVPLPPVHKHTCASWTRSCKLLLLLNKQTLWNCFIPASVTQKCIPLPSTASHLNAKWHAFKNLLSHETHLLCFYLFVYLFAVYLTVSTSDYIL